MKYCNSEYEKARKIKGNYRRTHRDTMWRDHKLMELAADCAGEKGARGAKWLLDRLESYLEFIGKEDGR